MPILFASVGRTTVPAASYSRSNSACDIARSFATSLHASARAGSGNEMVQRSSACPFLSSRLPCSSCKRQRKV
jgi:hypothetical protein